MDLFIFISLIIALGSLVLAFILEGGALGSLFQLTAALIVFGGTIGAVGVSFPFSSIKKVPKLFKIAFTQSKYDIESIINDFKDLSQRVRKDGLLVIESEIATKQYDPFMTHGLELVTDGVDGDMLKQSLHSRIDNMEQRHLQGISIFEAAGGFAPTMGVLGTVMGLIQVLGNLSEPKELGPKIAVAFIATLYGVGSANLLWLPIATRLKQLDTYEIMIKSMMVEGILLIYSGSNPALIEERLRGFLENEKEKRDEKREQ